jgi:hypothetical protein
MHIFLDLNDDAAEFFEDELWDKNDGGPLDLIA